MTVARKTIRGRLTTLTEAQVQAGARVTLSAVEVLEDGTTRDIGRVADLAGHVLMVADDTRSLTKEDGSFTFENVPVTDSTETSPTGFALQLTTVSAGEVLEQVVFLLPASDPDEQWVDELAAMGDTPLTPTYPQLVNEAVAALAAIPGTITATLTDNNSAATAVIVGRINAAITALVNGAPGALDTLKEISDQLGADESAAAAILAALNSHKNDHANPHAVTKAQVGLGSVDNTSDMAKPVSTAQAAAIATAISNLVAGAPGALDTLNELAVQLGSDENAAGALTTLVAGIRGLSDSTFLTGLNNAFAGSLTATAVKTSAYTAAAGDLVPVDATSGAVTVTLPTAPADRTRVAVKKIDASTNTVTVARGGSSDVFNKAGGSTSLTLTLTNQALNLQYSGGIWYVVADDVPLSGLDARFAKGSVVRPTPTLGPNINLGDVAASAAIASDVTTATLLNPGGTAYNNVIGGDGSATVNTTTPNVPITGTGANVGVVGGYDNVLGQISSKVIADHSYTELGDGSAQGHSAIFGGTGHVVRVAGHHSMVAGGLNNDMGAPYSLVAGNANVVDGAGSDLVAGSNHAVHGRGALVTGVNNVHSAGADYARIHGQVSQADGNFSSAEGQYAYARNDGQHARASTRIAALGDAQHSVTHFAIQTTDATETAMKPGAVGSVLDWAMVRGQTVLVECTIVARTVGGATLGTWKIRQTFKYDAAGSSSAVGAAYKITDYLADTGLAVRLDGASSTGLIKPKVTGLAATTINWSARFETTEVVA